ncbi:MAG: hypothetical protein C5B50_22745 [Verrucomicrobia bacterium]|nr:MAG: hypothetical protein C5B50_22745 [Verrucomicrobiota bacterium]
MPRVFHLKELEARKELLVAESEIRRETLRLELQNLQLYASGMKEKLSAFRSSGPLFLLTSLAGFFLGSPSADRAARKKRHRNRLARLVMGGLFGLRLYRRLRPILGFLFSRGFGRNGAAVAEEEQEEPAAADL